MAEVCCSCVEILFWKVAVPETNTEEKSEMKEGVHSIFSDFSDDDQTSGEATGLWSGGGARHQGAQFLPLHGLGEAGEQGGAATFQAESCKCDTSQNKDSEAK